MNPLLLKLKMNEPILSFLNDFIIWKISILSSDLTCSFPQLSGRAFFQSQFLFHYKLFNGVGIF